MAATLLETSHRRGSSFFTPQRVPAVIVAEVAACLIVGVALVRNERFTLLALGIGAAVAFLAIAPRAWIATVAIATTFVAIQLFPQISRVGQGEIRLPDAILGGAFVAAMIRGEGTTRSRIKSLSIALAAYGVLRTGVGGATISYLRVIEPLLLVYIVPRLVDNRYPIWRVVRVCATVICIQALVSTPPGVLRVTSWAGGPNETGLIAAALIIVTLATGGRRSLTTLSLVLGAIVVFRSGSLSTGIALGIGLVVLALQRRHLPRLTVFRRIISPAVAVLLLPFVIIIGVAARPDVASTWSIHTRQAESSAAALQRVNPIVGNGWKAAPALALQVSNLGFATFHDVYIDFVVNLGLIGLVLLLWLFWRIGRAGGIATAIIALVAVWLNTVGGFPDAAWGLVGCAAAAAVLQSPRRRSVDLAVVAREPDTRAPLLDVPVGGSLSAQPT